MTETKFTPGPWAVTLEGGAYMDGDGVKFYPVVTPPVLGPNGPTRDALVANAYLVSAAPDLYTAASELLEWVEGDEGFATDFPEEWERLVDLAKAALAKARGGA